MAAKGGNVKVRFGADTRDLERGAAKAGRAIDAFSRHGTKAGSLLGSSTKHLLAYAGGITSIAAAAVAAKDAVKFTEDLAKGTAALSRTTGLDTKTASEWVETARVRGVESQQLNRGFITLAKNMRQAELGSKGSARAFKDLGVSQQALASGDLNRVLFETADLFRQMPDGAKQAALAQQLFGRQSQTLIPLLNQGSGKLKEQLGLVDEYGVALDKHGVQQALKAVEAQRKWQLSLDGLKVAFASGVIPWLTKGVTAAAGFVREMRSGEGAGGKFAAKLKSIWRDAQPVVETMADGAKAIVKFADAHPAVTKLAVGLVAVGVAVKSISWAGQITGITKVLKLAGTFGSVGAKGGLALADGIASAFFPQWSRRSGGIRSTLKRTFSGIGGSAGESFASSAAGNIAGGASGGLAGKVGRSGVTGKLQTVFGGVGKVAGLAFKVAFVAMLPDLVSSIADQIKQKFPEVSQYSGKSGWGELFRDWANAIAGGLGRRRGGMVFQGGGTVPALVSSGEVIVEPGGSAWRAPGPPVAADNVPAMLKPGSAVLTWDGQARMMAGQSLASAVATQAPHFQSGGYAFHREPVGYGNHTHAGRGLAVPRSSTHGRSLGRFLTTAYGPPWDAIEGGGITSTGVKLTQGIQKFVVAVDPGVIAQHTPLNIWPNPFNDPGRVFWSEDTGGAIRGKHIDIFHAAADGTKDRWNKNATVWLAGQERGPGANTAGGRTVTKSAYAPPSPGTRRSSRASFDSGYEQGVSDPFGYGLAQHRTDFYNQARSSIFGTWTTTKRTSPSRPSRRRAAPTSGGGVVSDAKAILASGNTRFPLRLETGGTARRDFESIVSHGDGQAYVPHTGRWTTVKRSLMDALVSMAGAGGTWINALTGGNHTNGSHHYSGTAVDLDLGSPLGAGRIQSIARRFGGARNYETSHIHLDFRRGGRVQRFRTGTRSVSKAGGSWSGAPRNPHGDRNAAYQTLWRYINLGIGKNDQGKVKSALAQELRLIDRLDYNELRFFARDLKRIYAGPWPSTAVGRTEQARVSQLIKYTDDAIGRNLGRATGVTESVQDDISGISGRIENQLKLAGIDPDGAEGRRIIAAADTSAIGRLQGRRDALVAARTRALRAGRRDVAASIKGKITEVDDQILGLKVAIQDLTSTVGDATATAEQQLEQQRQTNELLQAQLDGVRKAMNVSQSQYGVLAKAIADIASGQIGGMLGLAVQSAGTPGVVARY